MKYRLLALDLDGTLLGPDQQVSAANRDAIAQALAAGTWVVPCTGRGWRESLDAVGDIPGLKYGVFNSGAVVVDLPSAQAVDLADFEPGLALELVEFLRDLPEAILVYQEHSRTGRDFLVTGDGDVTPQTRRWFTANQLKVGEIRYPTPDELRHSLRVGVVVSGQRAFDIEQRITERFGNRTELHCFAGVPTARQDEAIFIVEVFAKGVNKWRGLSWIAHQHRIDPAQIAAVGDEINDLAMLKQAGLGVAMANAVPAATQSADRTTLAHNEHGVAHAIRQMLGGHW
ncbi:MAG: HAD hydrolase family protein [Planctomycetota bacterium]